MVPTLGLVPVHMTSSTRASLRPLPFRQVSMIPCHTPSPAPLTPQSGMFGDMPRVPGPSPGGWKPDHALELHTGTRPAARCVPLCCAVTHGGERSPSHRSQYVCGPVCTLSLPGYSAGDGVGRGEGGAEFESQAPQASVGGGLRA